MNQIQYILSQELKNVAPDKIIPFLKARILSLPEENRGDAESWIEFLISTGLHTEKKVVVASVHGIRTDPVWQAKLTRVIEAKNITVVVKPIKFGFFDAFRFWIPIWFFRNKKIKYVTKQLRLLVKDNPYCDLVIVAHSFGTYLTAHSLKSNPDFEVKRILFCGSVLPEDYDWDSMPNKPKSGDILNDIGSKDIWPLLAKTLTFGYGASGVNGFHTHTVQNRYHHIGHSDFFSDEHFIQYWVPFILEGKYIESPHSESREGVNWFYSVNSLFSGQILIIFIIILMAACFYLFA